MKSLDEKDKELSELRAAPGNKNPLSIRIKMIS